MESMNKLAELKQNWYDAETEYRNALYTEFLHLTDNKKEADNVIDFSDTPLAWTVEGESHTFSNVSIKRGLGKGIVTFETESEEGGAEYWFSDLDTNLLEELYAVAAKA